MRISNLLPTLLIGLVSFSSCVVSKKKYDMLNSRKSALEVDKAECDELVKKLRGDSTNLADSVALLKGQTEGLITDTSKLGYQLRDLGSKYDKLKDISNKDARALSKQLSKVGKLNSELERKQAEIDKKNAALEKDQKDIAKLKTDLEAREKRVKELESKIAEQDKAVKKLKTTINKALKGFSDDELTIEMKDGKVYISLAEQLLFQSGKYDVDEKGKSALSKLAKAIKDNNDIDIVVEGHTDDVPMRGTGPISDNWDLSVKRATSIVKVLTGSGVDPKHVSAAGRAEFAPKVDGTTKEARAKNRRTEIIISPHLDELFELLGN